MPRNRPKCCRVPLGAREVTIIRRLKQVIKLPVTKIATAVDRNKSTIYDALDENWRHGKRGRKDLLTRVQVNLLMRVMKAKIKEAAAKREVTLAMIIKRAKVKAGERCVRKALQKRGVRFRRMRSKPILTKEDVKHRFAFAKKHRKKSRKWWQKQHIHLYHDIKDFPSYTNAAARAVAAQREVRGAYRVAADGLDENYVVLPKHLKYNTGTKSVRIAGGVGNGRVRLWHELAKKWNGKAAEALYLGPVRSALRRSCPRKRSYCILEDNDPTGFKSTAGEKAKKSAKIRVFKIPKRSPDLSVMDYAIWKQVTRNMRRQEKRFRKSKKETRAEFAARLERTAKNLPKQFIDKAIGNMKERCQRLYKARGHLFEEGGK